MYWIMLSERSDEYELSIDATPEIIEQQNLRFDCGDLLAKLPSLIDVPFDMQPDETMVDNIPAYGCRGLLINKKVKSVFEGLNIDNIQYVKARLINLRTNEILEPYWIANIVGKIACVDQEKSELEYYEDGQIKFIDKLVFKPMKDLQYGHIFRYAEFLPVIVVSDELKNALQGHDVSGFAFYRPEEFSL
jgi:hypothetical protein